MNNLRSVKALPNGFIVVLALLLLFGNRTAFSQNGSQQIIPESPEAYAFTKYDKQPVNLHTGLPEVQVPIYSIATRAGIQIPIGLSYHSGGIRVNEHATSVGLGWRLRAGGMISREVYGLPDLEGYPRQYPLDSEYENYPGFGMADIHTSLAAFGLWNNDDQPPCPEFWTQKQKDDYQYALEVLGLSNTLGIPQPKSIDALADMFYYSSPTVSGKFIFDAAGEVQTMPYKPHRISKDPGLGGGFRILDENGNLFEYDVAATYLSTPIVDPYASFIEHWKLTKIVTYLGEEIFFNYSSEAHTYQNRLAQVEYTNNSNGSGSSCQLPIHNPIPTEIQMNERRLEEIVFGLGRVEFTYSDQVGHEVEGDTLRRDLNGATALREITVYNLHDQIMKEFNLDQSYFSAPTLDPSDPDKYRLKLNAVTESGKPPHQFTYFGDDFMPHRLSEDQDHWGYYKEQTGGLLPYVRVGDMIMEGSDRSMNQELIKTGSLKSITYPTGGTTEFFFNTVEYLTVQEETQYQKNSTPVFSTKGTHSFSLPEDSNNSWQIIVQNDCGNEPGELAEILETGFCYFELRDENDVLITAATSSGIGNVSLDPTMDYKFVIDQIDFQQCNCSIWMEGETELIVEELKPAQIPGLRLDRIITDPIDGVPITTKYDYTDPNTGEISRPTWFPKFWYIQESYSYDPGTQTPNGCSFFARSGSPIETSNSSGYTNVKEYKEGNGSTQYLFNASTSGRQMEPILHFTFDSPISGRPSMIQHFDESGHLLSKETHSYLLDNSLNNRSADFMPQAPGFISMGISFNHEGYTVVTPCIGGDAIVHLIETNFIGMPNYWIKNTQVDQVSYYYEDGILVDSMSNTTEFYYDNEIHQQVTRVATTSSEERQLVTKTYFPDDIEHPGMSIEGGPMSLEHFANVGLLKSDNQHRISTPVQSVIYKDSALMSVNRTLYAELLGDLVYPHLPGYDERYPSLVLPSSILIAKGEGELEPITNFIYNDSRMLAEVRPEDGLSASILWGYHETLPIAKIDGVAYSDLDLTQIANLQQLSNQDIDIPSEQALQDALSQLVTDYPEAMVSGFTYDPLVGVTSTMDARGEFTYFLYDGNNRLQHVKDNDLNLLKSYAYNYAQVFDPLSIELIQSSYSNTYQNFGVNVIGGSGNYTYSWQPGNGSSNTDFLSEDGTLSTYQMAVACDEERYVQVTTTDNVTGEQLVEVEINNNPCANPPIQANILLNMVMGGTHLLGSDVVGGSGNYAYEWRAGIGETSSFPVAPDGIGSGFMLNVPCGDTDRWVELTITDDEGTVKTVTKKYTNLASCGGGGGFPIE